MRRTGLQVERSALLGLVGIVELLESVHHRSHVCLSAHRRLDVEDLASLIERETRGDICVCDA